MNSTSKYKKLSQNVGLVTIGQFSSKILTFLLVPLYTSVLTTSEFGIYDLIMSAILLLSPLLTITIGESVFRFSLEKEKYEQIISAAFYIIVFSTLILLLLYPVSVLINLFDGYYVWLVIIYFVHNIHLVLLQYTKGLNKLKLFSISGIISTLVTILLNVLLLVVFDFGIIGYMVSFLVAHITIIIIIISKLKIYKLVVKVSNININFLKKLLKYSFPMVPNSISWWVSNAMDKFLIRVLFSASMVGIYSVAYKIPSILSILATIFMTAWYISSVDNFGSDESKSFFSVVFNLFSSLIFVSTSGLVLFSKHIGSIMYRKDFFEAWSISTILILGYMFFSLSLFFASIYTASKKTKTLFYSTLIAAIINLILNIILIPKYSMLGASIATVISYFSIFIYRYVYSKNIIRFSIKTKKMISSISIIITQVVITFLDFNYSFHITLLLFLILLIINLISIDIQKFVKLLKSRRIKNEDL
jgi:O-antigen/teichoic acid export membrane protein